MSTPALIEAGDRLAQEISSIADEINESPDNQDSQFLYALVARWEWAKQQETTS